MSKTSILVTGYISKWNQNSLYNFKVIETPYKMEELEEIKDLSKKIIIKEEKLEENDRILFSSWSEIPRYKFNEFCENKNISRVITVKNCNKVVLDVNKFKSELNHKTSYDYIYKVDYEHLKAFLPKDYNFKDADIYVDSNIPYQLRHLSSSFTQEVYINITNIRYHLKENLKDFLLIKDAVESKKTFLSDRFVSTEINKGFKIDEERFNEISSMLSSRDSASISLAMDLMANSDYSENDLEIIILLNKHSSVFRRSSSYNKVNFKSLINHFREFPWEGQNALTFSTNLVKRFKNTENEEKVKKLCINSVKNYLNKYLTNDTFVVDTVRVV